MTINVLYYCILFWQERVCEDSASFDLNSADITLCVGDVTYLLNKIKSSEEEGNVWVMFLSSYFWLCTIHVTPRGMVFWAGTGLVLGYKARG